MRPRRKRKRAAAMAARPSAEELAAAKLKKAETVDKSGPVQYRPPIRSPPHFTTRSIPCLRLSTLMSRLAPTKARS